MTTTFIGGVTTIMGGGEGRRLRVDGDVNILLLVGAAGVGIFLLLLLVGLYHARRIHHATTSNEGGEENERTKKKKSANRKSTANNSTENGDDDHVVTFEPGKNNPGSRHSWFRRSSSINSNTTASLPRSPLRPPQCPPTNNSRPTTPNQYHIDDDESNADFVLARAALRINNNDSNNNNDSGGESLEDGDMESLGESFGYTVDGESLAPSRTATKYINGVAAAAAAAAAIPGTATNEDDSAIGAGGISSFTNDRGIFRWNENGTKMVYTPTSTKHKTGGGVVVGEEQNGFIFDEHKKKWVVKEKIIGGKSSKNVSFPSSTVLNTSTGLLEHLKRVRSNESTAGGSVISGMTGMSEFTYDQIGGANNNNTTDDNSRKVFMTNKKAASPKTPDDTGEEGFEISPSMAITLTPLTPATVYDDTNDNYDIDDIDKLLLRVGLATLSTPTHNVRPGNNNDLDDGSTSMMTGFTDVYDSSSTLVSGMTNIVTPERNGGGGNRYTKNNDDCGSSVHTGDPGRIIPKTKKKFESSPQQQLSSDGGGGKGGIIFGVGRRSVMTASAAPSMLKNIIEDTPFDEDIPFDERSKKSYNNNDNDRQILQQPEFNDNEDDDSQGSANSEHVLKDLDSLSKFMYERKRSEKMKKRGRVGAGGTRGDGSWDDSRTSSARFGGAGRTTTTTSTAGRKSSFGSRGI